MANDEEIDTEALQAQIDLSMSFMHGLVSSWIKSGSKQQPTRDNRNSRLENELKESVKRPPRLGVGAPVADSSVASTREAARLVGQLVGKRKNRTDDAESLKKKKSRPDDDDDEEESRTGAIKKKKREDPFATKKGAESFTAKKLPFSTATSSITGTQKSTVPSEKDSTDDTSLDFKENRKATSLQLHNSQSPKNDEQNGPKDSTLSSDTMANNQPVALPRSPSSNRKPTTPASLLNVPLLNLDGPVGGSSSGEEDEDHNQPQSPSKKKRKRRKRKKNKQNGSAQPGTGTP
ncbi:hypothetical protein Moror_8100 [Moniliophthora roreri MCA 2997]|uniref:Uncharacterized protein n=1 Tax=Moniliophthora roreri (strain MCA 2997) TaxID=1381753 RepID=V2XL20_MONRO|nr:hypothetical protein Moror_8100 [Moniliophthora roreri MCA 2997]